MNNRPATVVVSKLDDGVGVESGYTVMCVQEFSRGLKTLPLGVDEVCLPTLTTIKEFRGTMTLVSPGHVRVSC